MPCCTFCVNRQYAELANAFSASLTVKQQMAETSKREWNKDVAGYRLHAQVGRAPSPLRLFLVMVTRPHACVLVFSENTKTERRR
jgi:hypothetical protein